MTAVTIEPEWDDNKKNVSCIPEGEYIVKPHMSPTFKNCFIIDEVPGRDLVLFHAGNFRRDSKGCILPGAKFVDIDFDGLKDVSGSMKTMNTMIELITEPFKLIIMS